MEMANAGLKFMGAVAGVISLWTRSVAVPPAGLAEFAAWHGLGVVDAADGDEYGGAAAGKRAADSWGAIAAVIRFFDCSDSKKH